MSPAIVILDDDPTGTQAVADIPVVTLASRENLEWAFAESPRGFFILTNSRSLDEPAMRDLIRSIVIEVLKAAGDRAVRFVSRSDSTLRGHVVAEVDAIRCAIADAGLRVPATTVFVPAFPRAGRSTRDGVHLILEQGIERPANETHYAQDATFGYHTAFLPDLLAERSRGMIRAEDVAVVAAGMSASEDVARLVEDGVARWVVCDAENDDDLGAIVRGIERSDQDGTQVVIRCSPGLLPALLHSASSGELHHLGPPARAGGLVIVGSHVAQATRQLARLLSEPDMASIVLDVEDLVDAGDDARAVIVEEIAQEAAGHLISKHVVISTTRTVHHGDGPKRSLSFARGVSEALVRITRRVHELTQPSFVVAKGGITSSDIATRALGIERAMVRGRVGAGIVWVPVGAELSSAPLALVPGNIGDDDGLLDAVRGISYQRSSRE